MRSPCIARESSPPLAATRESPCSKENPAQPKINNFFLKCSTLLVIREIQIKTTMRCQFTPTRRALITMTDDNTTGEEVGRLEPSSITGWKVKRYSLCCTWENSWAVSQKVKYRITIGPNNSTPWWIPDRNENMSTQIFIIIALK